MNHRRPKQVPRNVTGTGRRGGATVIEAALVLSLIVMLSLGAGQYGYVFFLKHSLQNAASAGMRVGILPNSTDAQVQSAVAAQLGMTGMGGIKYTLTTTPNTMTGCANGTSVVVTVSCTWGNVGINVLPSGMGGFASTKTFTASAMGLHE